MVRAVPRMAPRGDEWRRLLTRLILAVAVDLRTAVFIDPCARRYFGRVSDRGRPPRRARVVARHTGRLPRLQVVARPVVGGGDRRVLGGRLGAGRHTRWPFTRQTIAEFFRSGARLLVSQDAM
jgi:hypothetical protein